MRSATGMTPSTGRRPGFWGGLTEDTITGIARRKVLLAYLFLTPTLLGILVFTAGPVLVSFGLSLYEWNVIEPASFIGMGNYRRLLTDSRVIVAFRNTLVFVVLAVGLQLVVALFLAIAVQQKMPTWLRYIFRSAFFLPLLTSAATIAVVLAYMFHSEFGVINYYLSRLGLPRVNWLNSERWALITIVLTYVWQQVGFTFIIFIGGLTNISKEVMEAADVDGAMGWRRLWHVTLPLLSPTILFAAVVGVISALQVFSEPFVMTKGGPGDASRTVVMIIYESAFQNLEIGYGSAIAVFLFIVIMLVTGAQFWLGKRSVFYQ